MATSITEVFDLFMMKVTDYRLSDLFDLSEEDFETYLEAWLKMSVVEFSVCNQDLTYDINTMLFDEELTVQNQVILATLMMKQWMQKNVNDVTQMNLHITDRDFKVYSEAQNLREKVVALNAMKEEISQLLNTYAYENNDWESWIDESIFFVA